MDNFEEKWGCIDPYAKKPATNINIEKLDKNDAKLPTLSIDGDGYNLFAAHQRSIKPFKSALLGTNLEITFPDMVFAKIIPSVGNAKPNSQGFYYGSQMYDSTWTLKKDLTIFIYNDNQYPLYISKFDKIAKIIFYKHEYLPRPLKYINFFETKSNPIKHMSSEYGGYDYLKLQKNKKYLGDYF